MLLFSLLPSTPAAVSLRSILGAWESLRSSLLIMTSLSFRQIGKSEVRACAADRSSGKSKAASSQAVRPRRCLSRDNGRLERRAEKAKSELEPLAKGCKQSNHTGTNSLPSLGAPSKEWGQVQSLAVPEPIEGLVSIPAPGPGFCVLAGVEQPESGGIGRFGKVAVCLLRFVGLLLPF